METRINYDSFGEILGQTNSSVGDRFTFAGREFDSETGLYYNRARYYDANLGRFISQDPIGFAGEDANLYRYVGNDPVNATDPSGLVAALQYSRRLGEIFGKPVEFGVSVNPYEVSGATIGFLQGFGATNLIFIGEVLGLASTKGSPLDQTDFSTALNNTEKKMQEIVSIYKILQKLDNKGLVGGFVNGVNVNVSLKVVEKFKFKIPKQGGFKNGYGFGIEYIKDKLNIPK
ncbi:MAG: RHS repeat-associated core domain-containing protein [Nostocales cyanobacterium 94392]|nr:RHS repeat-associated core domain-containing protein [Nostocales cyanobacterium 94392]